MVWWCVLHFVIVLVYNVLVDNVPFFRYGIDGSIKSLLCIALNERIRIVGENQFKEHFAIFHSSRSNFILSRFINKIL